jgi:hypothetical protein
VSLREENGKQAATDLERKLPSMTTTAPLASKQQISDEVWGA